MSANTRDSIRAAVFGQKPKSELVTFAGTQLEIRQPPIGAIINGSPDDRQAMITKMLMDYCFVPGTDDKVFEAADRESILAMPFNQDWTALQEAIVRLTNLDKELTDQAKN